MARLELQCDARHDEHEKIWRHTNEIQQSLDNMEKRHQQTVVPHILQTNDTIEHLHQTLNELKTNAVTRDTTLRTLSAKFHSSAGAFATQLQQQYRHVMVRRETIVNFNVEPILCAVAYRMLLRLKPHDETHKRNLQS